MFIPDRGDLVWLTFDPQVGREQAGRHPALVVSPRLYNERSGLALVCPITSRRKGYPFEVPVPDGLPVAGMVLADHIKSIDWAGRRLEYVGHSSPDLLAAVLDRLAPLLGC